jgi:5,10-methylene-tetrahydrofolate dehydrogenase/methenyl tetrahydrofolate cyclohydrolase
LKAAHNITPGLAVILVGSRKDSQSYAGLPSLDISWWTLDMFLRFITF